MHHVSETTELMKIVDDYVACLLTLTMFFYWLLAKSIIFDFSPSMDDLKPGMLSRLGHQRTREQYHPTLWTWVLYLWSRQLGLEQADPLVIPHGPPCDQPPQNVTLVLPTARVTGGSTLLPPRCSPPPLAALVISDQLEWLSRYHRLAALLPPILTFSL